MVSENGTQTQEGSRAPALKPLDEFEGTLSNRVYLSLREAILTLEYRPGQILRKQQVCEALDVSRSPVSEAVARLASEGLVVILPQAGTYVARFSMDEIRESAFLREALELAAVEYLAPVITQDQIRQLKRNLRVQEALVEDGDVAGFYELDGEMHLLLLNFTGFRRLAKMADSVWLQVSRARRLILPEPGRVVDTLAEHRDIVSALEAGDTEAARTATRHHLRQLLTYLEPLEQSRPDLFS
ncbi:MAG: GntR family transcriptional regulator [Rhodobacteraceae bacterium]|nr:MAG: GntR family transcriptional regulator [Paracoccaceae bacterium]